jgi:glucan phosphoethanolaminetransferase (alkaline phosphatase superfamily)
MTNETRPYTEENTFIPLPVFLLLLIIGTGLLIVSLFVPGVIFPLAAFLFLMAATFAAPMTGIYTDQLLTFNNTTSNLTENTIQPVVQLTTQPWIMWFLWGLSSIAFILIWYGVITYFKDLEEVENRGKWI